jgi:hypothetical protein
MSSVKIYVPMDIVATVARDAMLDLMPKIEKGEHPYETLSLGIALRVPIHAAVVPQPLRYECELDLTALHDRGIFPKFHGSISVTPTNDTCELWLIGDYDPPLGAAGALLDATVLHGTALRTLQTLLDWLAKEILACALESEKRQASQVLSRHMGS